MTNPNIIIYAQPIDVVICLPKRTVRHQILTATFNCKDIRFANRFFCAILVCVMLNQSNYLKGSEKFYTDGYDTEIKILRP